MPKEVRLYQLSHKVYGVLLKEIFGTTQAAIIQKIKINGGRWNHAINCYEIPLHNATAFLKDVRTSDPKIIIEDVPVEELKKVICMKLKDNIEGKTVYLKPKSKWHRILLHDPWLFRRYEFISNFVCPRNTEKRSWKKVLLFCSEANKINWQQKAFGNNVDCIEADSNSLLLESQKKLKTMMCQSEVEILTYEKLQKYGDILTAQVMDQYTSVVFDEIDVLFNCENDFLRSPKQAREWIKLVLKDRYAVQCDLIMVSTRLGMGKGKDIIDLCHLLKPTEYGIDMLKVMCGEANDVSWMSRRYKKQYRMLKEFLYVLTSTLLISLAKQETEDSDRSNDLEENYKRYRCENKFYLQLLPASIERFKCLDSRYTKQFCKLALMDFQNNKSNKLIITDIPKLNQEEAKKYMKEVRELMIEEKMPFVLQQIITWVGEYGIKIAIIVENFALQEKVVIALRQQQIGCCVYEIKYNDSERQNWSYDAFNRDCHLRVLIINREKLLKEYKKALNDYEHANCERLSKKLEEELLLQAGQGNLLTHWKGTNQQLLYSQENFELKKITTIRHIICLDTHWYQFSEEKQQIVDNIFDINLPFLNHLEVNELSKTEEGNFMQQSRFKGTSNRINLVKHFFVCKASNESKGSYEAKIVDKYCSQLHEFEEEMASQKEMSKMSLNAESTVETFLNKIMLTVEEDMQMRQRIGGIVDIDEDFDRLEFEAMKQKEKDEAIFDEVNPNDEPQYNNFLIEGLKVETQYVNDQLKKQIQAFEIVPAKNVFDKRVTVRQPTKLNHEIQTMELSIKKDSKNQAMQQEQSAEIKSSFTKAFNLTIEAKPPVTRIDLTEEPDNKKVKLTLKPQKKKYIAKPVQICSNRHIQWQLQSRKQGIPGRIQWYGTKNVSKKVIAPKYKSLKVQLLPFKSSLV